MRKFIQKKAEELGFSRAYFVPWGDRTAALLVWAYKPYDKAQPVPAYYIASNRAYHAAKALAREAQQAGFACRRSDEVLVRSCALNAGIGTVGRNGLLRIDPFGSRIVVEALLTDGCDPLPYHEPARPCPPGCNACREACPAGAIGEGYDPARCMRGEMDTALHPEWVRRAQSQFIGCEACMFACPYNAPLGVDAPPEEARAAFDLARLISGDAKAARTLVGRNITANGKLIAEAIVFAARAGRYRPEIEAARSSEFRAVREVAEWALSNYEFKD